ncbi:MAG: WG repeat-containing protein [Bacteroidales bacterium]|nr:WG repeat-containing protein [Bacteroidales bacterium]
MKRTLITIMTLCCFTFVAEAQKTKVVLETLQKETQSLQRKVDSLERLSWQQEALIKTLESRADKLNDKLRDQAEAFNKKIEELNIKIEDIAANPLAVADAPFEFIPDATYNADRLLVKHGAYYGFIDRSENLVIPCVYDEPGYFNNKGIAAVKKNGKWGVIDTNEKVIIPFEYDVINYDSDIIERGLIYAKKIGKWGVIQYMSGKIIIPFQYDEIYYSSDNYFVVRKDGKRGRFDLSGRVI